MAEVGISQSQYTDYLEHFVFERTAVMNAAEEVEVYWNGNPNASWYPIQYAVYSGQICCICTCIDSGSGSQAVGSSHVQEFNVVFKYVSGVSSIPFEHQYFKYTGANMNGTWDFSVNPTNQGIIITWEAPSGASNTTFKMRCVANVNQNSLNS